MTRQRIGSALVGLLLGLSSLSTAAAGGHMAWHFEDVAVGALPPGWHADATHPNGRIGKWAVVHDLSAPSPDHALGMVAAGESGLFGHYGSLFNLCWTDQARFRDGEISVRFKALSGREDQGGGLMWRVRDRNNYYVARFNPLEDNFRLYRVRNGHRRTLASADATLAHDQWHRMRIVLRGSHYSAWLDGRKLLDGDDATFPDAGGAGLWTKADAVTEFDDFTVTPR